MALHSRCTVSVTRQSGVLPDFRPVDLAGRLIVTITLDMIETIRENREDDVFRLLIERKHGVWAIELKSAKVPNLERGTGVDFNQAWDNITETIP
jgi:hypothetical protein